MTERLALRVDGREVRVAHEQVLAAIAQLAAHAEAGAFPEQLGKIEIIFREGHIIDVDFVGRLPRAHY